MSCILFGGPSIIVLQKGAGVRRASTSNLCVCMDIRNCLCPLDVHKWCTNLEYLPILSHDAITLATLSHWYHYVFSYADTLTYSGTHHTAHLIIKAAKSTTEEESNAKAFQSVAQLALETAYGKSAMHISVDVFFRLMYTGMHGDFLRVHGAMVSLGVTCILPGLPGEQPYITHCRSFNLFIWRRS